MTTFDDLPPPNPEAEARSRKLIAHLRTAIQDAGGSIAFDRFMADALYHPESGYYTSPHFKLGRHGDFTTAAELTPLYAACFAETVSTVFASLDQPSLLEVGAGSGQFAVDLLQALHKKGTLPAQYYIHEISPSLREQQRQRLATHCPEWLSRIVWCDTLPTDFTGVIIANEVLDALPVHCFERQAGLAYERRVTWGNNAFAWLLAEPTPPLSTELTRLESDVRFADQILGEVSLHCGAFIHTLAQSLQRGLILFADYGYGRELYYHPGRHRGTLTCFYQHHKHDNPLILLGLQDITAHVDFTRVAEAGLDAGCTLAGYTTQAGFLLENGLIEKAEQAQAGCDEKEKFMINQAIKTLTLPTEMGEVIKVLGLAKGLEHTLAGMTLCDRRREL